MTSNYTLVVLLFINEGCYDDFEQFESRAFAIMARYGGKLERRVRLASTDASTPDELHIVTFANRDDFERYAADEELRSLADLRSRAIARTTIYPAQDLPLFM